MSTSGPLTDVSLANTVNATPKIDELTPEQRRMLEEQMEAYGHGFTVLLENSSRIDYPEG